MKPNRVQLLAEAAVTLEPLLIVTAKSKFKPTVRKEERPTSVLKLLTNELLHSKLELIPVVLLKIPWVYLAAVGVAVASWPLLKAKNMVNRP